MGVRRTTHRLSLAATAAAVLLLLFIATSLCSFPHTGRTDGIGASRSDGWLSRRRLRGPGSSPPTCRSKCGNCSPCKPVHVPIHPSLAIPLEYYPEAWRCKCGNKLFMP